MPSLLKTSAAAFMLAPVVRTSSRMTTSVLRLAVCVPAGDLPPDRDLPSNLDLPPDRDLLPDRSDGAASKQCAIARCRASRSRPFCAGPVRLCKTLRTVKPRRRRQTATSSIWSHPRRRTLRGLPGMGTSTGEALRKTPLPAGSALNARRV
jgi:hypothetical protein